MLSGFKWAFLWDIAAQEEANILGLRIDIEPIGLGETHQAHSQGARASETAKDEGAPMATTKGICAIAAFWMSSNPARPDKTNIKWRQGKISFSRAWPITLSTAL